MANNLFTDTVFVDEETPTSTKLNTWNTRVSDGLDLLASAISKFGGDDRVIDDPAIATELKVVQTVVADMNVTVNAGIAIVSGTICQNETTSVKSIVAPTTSNRYTIVQISNVGVITTVDSAEQAVPVEPNASADNIKLAAIYLPQNTTKIEDAAGAFGYIIDRRTPTALHPTTVTRHMSLYFPGQLQVAGGPNGDGYYFGKVASGWTPGIAITIQKVTIQAFDTPTGANLVFTFHNLTNPTSDTATLTAADYFEEDATIDLDLDATDELAIQVTTVGSTNPGGDVQLVIEYVAQ